MATDIGGPCARHSAYVGHPDADNYSKHLLTLLAQRRELQSDDVRRLLTDLPLGPSTSSSGAAGPSQPGQPGQQCAPPLPPLPPSLFSGTATNTSVERERRELQAELGLGLEWRARPSMAESCRAAVEGAGKPLAGLNNVTALTWHFRARQAELVVEQRQLLRHVAALRRQHFGHVVGHALPPEVHRQPPWRHQLDHAGTSWQGELRPCGCEREMALANECMQAMQLAEADAAARHARLTTLRCADDSDWWAALHWAVTRLPAGRPADRFFDRLRVLPLSHHHRFPIYEQVCGSALRRDQHAAASGLRVPPRVATTNAESVQQLEQLFREFEDLVQPLGSDVGQQQPSSVSTESIPLTVATDNSARHHKAAYEARRILPRVLERHRRRWPGASALAAQQQQQQQQQQAEGSPAGGGAKSGPESSSVPEPLERFPDDPACSPRDQVHVVRMMDEQLAALVPSLEGDESAGYQAMLRTLPLHIDEVLKAENDFLNECSEALVHDRLRSLAEQHVDRWTTFGAAEPAIRMTLSRANAPWANQRLQDKTMEALHVVRFLATKRNKIKVLHYLNAIASVQIQLLRDERDEEALVQPFPTTAAKDFTCPFGYANSTAGGSSSNGGGSAATAAAVPTALGGGGAAAGAASGGAANSDVEFDLWTDDPEAGVAVRAPDGKWVLYAAAVEQFKVLETELLRLATYHLEVYAGQVHAAATAGGAAAATAAAAATGMTPPPAGGGAGSSSPSTAAAVDALQMVDRLTVLADMWECEAQYCAARHKALLAYYHAYRHATGWGLADVWGGCSPDVLPFSTSAAGAAAAAAAGGCGGGGGTVAEGLAPWLRTSANAPQPRVLGARQQLRRELIDLSFRRPNLALEDGYFMERYHSETLALELEASLVSQLTALVAQHERWALAAAFTSAAAAASAARHLGVNLTAPGWEGTAAAAKKGDGGAAGGGSASTDALWKPGYHAGVVYGGVLTVGQRGLFQEGATLPAVGSAAASLPAQLRAACSSLSSLHQLRHHVELADLRRVVLHFAVTEMAVLLREEAYRAHAPVERQPKDSMYDSTRGRRDLPPDAPLLRGNWLVASHVADNVEVVRAVAVEAGAEPRAALEAFLNKEVLIRQVYRGEMLWLVYVVQARALGRRVQYSELHGIDWGQIDAAGNALKAEMLHEVVQLIEPDDIAPPGAAGPGDEDDLLAVASPPPRRPGGKARSPGGSRRSRRRSGASTSNASEGEGGEEEEEESPGARRRASEGDEEEGLEEAAAAAAVRPRCVMLAVGTRGLLGGVWRSPPLALAEFSTFPAESLNPHSLAGLRSMLRPGEPAHSCLPAAVRAQVLRAVALEVSIRHNQVLLDGIIRKLDRRRRVLMWRTAALEGVGDAEAMDVVIGGPPGAYSPASHPLTCGPPAAEGAGGSRGGGGGRVSGGGGGGFPGSSEEEAERRSIPPLLREPPGDRVEEYHKSRRNSNSARAWMRRFSSSSSSSHHPGGASSPPGAGHHPGAHPTAVDALEGPALEDLKQRRRALTAAAGAMYLDIYEIKMRLRVQARRSYVQGLLRSKGAGGGGPEAEAAVRAETESSYVAAFLAELLPAASRTHMAAAVRELAVLLLGGTGGYGGNWGLQYDADGQLLGAKEDRGPLFPGPDGQVALRAAVLEYGPMWQAIMFQLADKKNDPDPMDWAPAAPAIGLPSAIGFVQVSSSHQQQQSNSGTTGTTGAASGTSVAGCQVRLEALWGLPGQWEVLHAAAVHYPPGPTGLSALEKGVAVASLVVEVVRHYMFQAALLAPSSTLAAGRDVSGQTAGLAPLTRAAVMQATPVSYSSHTAAGQALCQQSEVRMLASRASLLPGALLAADLVKLQARLQLLHRPPGVRPTGASGPSSAASNPTQPSPTQPADDVVAALRRELGVLSFCRVLAVARVRDTFLTTGPTKRAAWFLSGALEHLLARTASCLSSAAEDAALGPAAPPPPQLPLPACYALRLPDPDRLALHNEAGRLGLALERCLHDCKVPAATAPHDALALQEYFLGGMWAHDRLRDALAWRALLMEAPESYPFSPAHVGTFLRRYHSPTPPLCLTLFPPAATVEGLQAMYGSKVVAQAKALVTAAETYVVARSTSRQAGAVDEGGGGGGSTGREGPGEGKPAWLAASPGWGCAEVRFLEACCVACKQQLDLQAVQVALLRLHQDCAQLAGLRSVAVGFSTSGGSSSGSALGAASPLHPDQLHPHAVPAAAVTVFARKLAARQRRGGASGDMVVEINMDDLLRWLCDAVTQLTASARSGLAAAAAASQRERAALHGLVDGLEGAVGSLAMDQDTFMRRHEIKVETQVVDRAMSLLLELSQARRSALRGAEDARRAMDIACTSAHKQYGSHIDELNNQLIVARTNSSIMRSELQKAALEALIEVRREMLNRAFAAGTMKMNDDIGRMLALERQLEESQTEILDLQRSMNKLQAWFKMRSSAFLTACTKEVTACRSRSEALEAELWELRERAELTVEQLTTQLRATQADLEAVSAGAARNALELKHALTSNKKLLKWKVTTAPRIEALKMKMADITRNREAWQEWVNSKQGLMQHLGAQLMAAQRQQSQLQPPQRGPGGIRGPSGSGAGGRGGLATDAELEAVRQQWELERRTMQQEIARLKTELSNERLVKNDVFERLMRLEQQYLAVAQVPPGTAAEGIAAVGVAAAASSSNLGGGAGRPGPSPLMFGRSPLSPMQADILSRRYEELRSSHQTVKEENAALRRTLASLRTVAPDLVASLEFPLMMGGGAAAAAGTTTAAPSSTSPNTAAHTAAAAATAAYSSAGGTATGLGLQALAAVAALGGEVAQVVGGSPAWGAAASLSPGMTMAGAIRPGTAGRLRQQAKAAHPGAVSDSPGGGGAGSPGGGWTAGGSPRVKTGSVGASRSRPPSASTYALRNAAGVGMATGSSFGASTIAAVQRPRSSRPGAAAAAAAAAGPGAIPVPVPGTGTGVGIGIVGRDGSAGLGGSPSFSLEGLGGSASPRTLGAGSGSGEGSGLGVTGGKMGTPTRPGSARRT